MRHVKLCFLYNLINNTWIYKREKNITFTLYLLVSIFWINCLMILFASLQIYKCSYSNLKEKKRNFSVIFINTAIEEIWVRYNIPAIRCYEGSLAVFYSQSSDISINIFIDIVLQERAGLKEGTEKGKYKYPISIYERRLNKMTPSVDVENQKE